MWAIEVYLRRHRREVDGMFGYRYSQLLFVFAVPVRRGCLAEGIRRLAAAAKTLSQEI